MPHRDVHLDFNESIAKAEIEGITDQELSGMTDTFVQVHRGLTAMHGMAHGADAAHLGHLLETAALLTGLVVVAGAAAISRVRRTGVAPARGRPRGYSGPR